MASGTELRLCRMAAAPYPAYNPKSPLAQGLLKLPVLAASTAWMRAEGRVLQGRCLGPTRSLQG
ncbi:LysR family transcriptional regulator [Klebsiella pneumoniae]|uniref:LysR family transcriptional regulator n=1 Tax=Klebsiella pneumoniae TaxID=573 RepID=UPI0010101B1F|nr:LysR family transcriptional regulator [Klebsiella pneumoniae]